MHFVFFGPDEHLKAVGQQRLREPLHPLTPAIPFLKQQGHEFALGAWPFFLALPLLEQRSKVKAFERREVLLFVDESIKIRY